MKKTSKIWLLIATLLLLIGGGFLTISLANNNWDFLKQSIITNTHVLEGEFNNIIIESHTADIEIKSSSDNVNKVVCKETEKETHIVKVNDKTLNISIDDQRKPYEKLFSFDDKKITIYLTNTIFESLTINGTTGDVIVSDGFSFKDVNLDLSTGDVKFYGDVSNKLLINITTGDVDIKDAFINDLQVDITTGDMEIDNIVCNNTINLNSSTGDIEIENVVCLNFTSNSTTGDITMKKMIVSENIVIEGSTGDVIFDMCDAMNIDVNTTTGDIKGTLLSSKIFNVNTTSGHKIYPNTTTGGQCNLNTTTGDINIKIV